VSGNLVGSDGSPVANAYLYLDSTGSPTLTEFQGETDDSGDYILANVPSGTYQLNIQPAYGTNAYVGGYLTADGGVTNDQAQAAAIVVSADTCTEPDHPGRRAHHRQGCDAKRHPRLHAGR
jgi:hypothetical protein